MSVTVPFSIMSELKRLGSQSAVYGVTAFNNAALGLILIPLYGHFLTPQELGELQLVKLWLAIGSTVAGLGLVDAYFKAYHLYPSEEMRQQTFGLVFLLTILGTVGVCVIFIMLSFQTFTHHFDLLDDLGFLALVLSCVVGLVFNRLLFQILRAQERSQTYLNLASLGLITGLGLNILFVWGFSGKVHYILAAQALSAIVMLVVGLHIMQTNLRLSFDQGQVKQLLRFGLPLVPAAIALWILEGSDRIVLEQFWGTAEVGIYSLGYKYASALQFPLFAFQAAWGPYLFSIAKQEHAAQLISRILTYLTTTMMMMALLAYLLRVPILTLVATDEYAAAEAVVGPVLLGFLCYGFYIIAISASYIHGKTGMVAMVVGAAALMNLFLNVVYIPSFGGIGAAWTTAASYLLLAGMMYRLNQKKIPLILEWRPLAGVTSCCVAILGLCSQLTLEGWEAWLIPMGLVMVIPVLLWFSGFVTPSERQHIYRYLGEWKGASTAS